MRFRYADEVLYAIGVVLMSLEPPKNPDVAPLNVLNEGERIFRREGCASCQAPPAYTTGKLTVADGFNIPPDHPNRADIVDVSVGTDADVALKTRKGTGLYKIPSLRGVWYRPRLLHDGSLASLEEMFDATRLDPNYQPKRMEPSWHQQARRARAHVRTRTESGRESHAAGVSTKSVGRPDWRPSWTCRVL